MNKRQLLQSFLAASALSFGLGSAHAQTTPIKFQLDWRFEGPAALFLYPAAKGYFVDLARRRQKEASTLADLTGWPLVDIRNKMQLGAAAKPDKWLERLWD